MKNDVRYVELPILLLGIPLCLCLLFRLLPLGSIGPLVFFYGLVQVIVCPFLVFRLIMLIFNKKKTASEKQKPGTADVRPAALIGIVILSAGSGVIAGIIGWNLFIGLTWVFNLMDYQLL